MSAQTLVTIDDLRCLFPMRRSVRDFVKRNRSFVHAVDQVTFAIRQAEIVALVGESGCGKSTVGRMLVRLQDPTGGEIWFEQEPVADLDGDELRAYRKKAQIIFQNPFEAFDPRLTVGSSLLEAMSINDIGEKANRTQLMEGAMERAGLTPAGDYLDRYPHELSGGQSQRVATVRAMLLAPKLLVADEPVSMLDVSVRAEILNQMLDLRDNFGMAILFITHDLAVARYAADRIMVMYLGMIVERGEAETLLANPRHPYTRALLSNTLPANDLEERLEPLVIGGEVPTPVDLKPGCRFAQRCPFVFKRCLAETPQLLLMGDATEVACFLYQ